MAVNPSCKEARETYTCIGCGRDVCRDCNPSPTEADDLCSLCYWIDDPDRNAA